MVRWAGRGIEGAFVDWLAFGGVTLRLGPDGAMEPVRPTLECGAVHPDAYRRAVCAREMYHDGYHATDDKRTEWQTADLQGKAGISCVTIDRAAGHQHLTYSGGPGVTVYPDGVPGVGLKPGGRVIEGDGPMMAMDMSGWSIESVGGVPLLDRPRNRKARRAEKARRR